jgi:hypothetical protein
MFVFQRKGKEEENERERLVDEGAARERPVVPLLRLGFYCSITSEFAFFIGMQTN